MTPRRVRDELKKKKTPVDAFAGVLIESPPLCYDWLFIERDGMDKIDE
jgi:hypothetical protein